MWDLLKQWQDQIVIGYYNAFVGEQEVADLIERFDNNQFTGKWDQVMTSLTTGLFGTGIGYSSVQANYSLNSDGTVKVVNSAFDNEYQFTTIEGTSRDRGLSTCRTVSFPSLFPSIEGDYWILYISPTFNSIIVGSPLILPGLIPIKLSDNFALYVLARDSGDFWASSEETKGVFDALKKYGFTSLWNRPYATGSSFALPKPAAATGNPH